MQKQPFILLGAFICYSLLSFTSLTAQSTTQESKDIHVAFAGGGWRAHTGHSAWIMSLLKANEASCKLESAKNNSNCLNSALRNVKTISANSGGSWFSAMLMYDPDFVNQITRSNVVTTWGAIDSLKYPHQGWLGKQQNYFEASKGICDTNDKFLQEICFKYKLLKSGEASLSWNDLVENAVFYGYKKNHYKSLGSDSKLPWAKDKSLLMAGSLLTNSVVLNHDPTWDEYYYQACQFPNFSQLDRGRGGWCLDRYGQKTTSPDVWPVTFTSLASINTPKYKPGFISTKPGRYYFGYTKAHEFYKKIDTVSIWAGINTTDDINVIHAAAASSAAVGFAASRRILSAKCELWECAYAARNLSLGFKISSETNQVSFLSAQAMDSIPYQNMTQERVMRIADGGSVDNSAISQLISFLQNNDEGENFNIVAFDDIQMNDSGYDSTAYPSSDLSNLFEGAPGDTVCFDKICLEAPDLQVVRLDETERIPMTKRTWYVDRPDGFPSSNSLYYFTYQVITVDNPVFNIKAGMKGTIHVFASEFGSADTAPNDDKDFIAYNMMIQSFKPTLNKKPDEGPDDQTGLALLKQAFGLN